MNAPIKSTSGPQGRRKSVPVDVGGVTVGVRLAVAFVQQGEFFPDPGFGFRAGPNANGLDVDVRVGGVPAGGLLAACSLERIDAGQFEVGQEPCKAGRHDRLRLVAGAGDSRFNVFSFVWRRRARQDPNTQPFTRQTLESKTCVSMNAGTAPLSHCGAIAQKPLNRTKGNVGAVQLTHHDR